MQNLDIGANDFCDKLGARKHISLYFFFAWFFLKIWKSAKDVIVAKKPTKKFFFAKKKKKSQKTLIMRGFEKKNTFS